jgi:hypothetical protein
VRSDEARSTCNQYIQVAFDSLLFKKDSRLSALTQNAAQRKKWYVQTANTASITTPE